MSVIFNQIDNLMKQVIEHSDQRSGVEGLHQIQRSDMLC